MSNCKGCGKCCHLQTYAGDYKLGTSKKFDEYLKVFGINQDVYNKSYKLQNLKPGTIVYHKNARCPNLDVNNRCKIYEHRPKMCREFPRTKKDQEFISKENINCGVSFTPKETWYKVNPQCICRTEKRCSKCGRIIRVGETHFRSRSSVRPTYTCRECNFW